MILDRTTVFFQMWPGISAWYPPVALALALLVGVDFSFAPLLVLAGAAATIVNYNATPFSVTFWVMGLAIAAVYTGAAYVLRRVLRVNPAFLSLRDVK